MRLLFESWLNVLLICTPAALLLKLFHADPMWVFFGSALTIVPLAGSMGTVPEHLSAGVGSLLNASLGNAAELLIALAALREGLHGMVKASLTGSIIGNILLILDAAMVAGGVRHERPQFNQTAASTGASLLLLSAVALVIPALFHFTASQQGIAIERD